MSRIEWEYNLVERPFCEQLQTMGWSWIEGDVDVAELTERESFREVRFCRKCRVGERITMEARMRARNEHGFSWDARGLDEQGRAIMQVTDMRMQWVSE